MNRLQQQISDSLLLVIRHVVARWPGRIVLAAIALTVAAIACIALTWNINSDFKALLPQDSRAAVAMDELGARVGSGSALFVVIDSPSQQANIDFATELSGRLRALDQVALAHFHNDKDFFEAHGLLYLQVEDLERLEGRLSEELRDAKKKANPLFIDLGDVEDDDEQGEGGEDAASLEALREKYEEDLAHARYKEYLVSDDGYALTIVVRFVESSTDLAATNALLERIEALAQEVGPAAYHPEMTVELGGGLANRKREYGNIVSDIQSSAVFTVLGVLLLIALYFRRLRGIVVVLTPLVMSVLWTLAMAFLIFGELTTITAFIFAILLGLGIDFGIHLLSSYDQLRAQGLGPQEALESTYSDTGRATTLAALTTLATFLVLSLARFRGLSQFGAVASIGMVLTLAAMVLVLPALVLVLQRRFPYEPPEGRASRLRSTTAFPARIYVPLSLTAALALTAFCVTQLDELGFEENFRQIAQVELPWGGDEMTAAERARWHAGEAAKSRAGTIFEHARAVRRSVAPKSFVMDREQETLGAKYSTAVQGQQSSTPTVLLFDEGATAEQVFRWFEEKKRAEELETIRSVGSIYAFLPASQAEQQRRLEVIERLDELLEDSAWRRVEGEDLERVERLRQMVEAARAQGTVEIYDLPPWTKRLFKEAGPKARAPAPGEEFSFETLVYVNEAIDHMDGDRAREFLAEIDAARQATGIDFLVGSPSNVYVSMLDAIRTDGPLFMAIALCLVFLLLLIALRSPWRAVFVLLPLLVGLVWTLGLAAWLGLRLDFFNVVIIPAIIGIGVDDGVHFYYRYGELGRGQVGTALRQIGMAVGMTSATNLIGFGGLAITQYAGLQSIGYLAFVGIGSTFLATMLIMPTGLWLAERYNWRWLLPRPGAFSGEAGAPVSGSAD